jgi:maleylacetate reductase
MLPYCTALAAPWAPGSDQRIVAALDRDGMHAAEAIAAFAHRLGAPGALRDLGLREDELGGAIELVDATLSQLPEAVSRSETDALLRAAFAGTAPIAEMSAR